MHKLRDSVMALPAFLKSTLFVVLVAAFVAVTLSIDAWGAYNVSTTRWIMIIFVTIAVAGAVYKCIAFSTMRTAWHEKAWGRWFMLLILLLVAWAQSMTFELTFYSTLYGDSAQSRQSEIDISGDRKKEKLEIEARLEKRATKRTPEEIASDIERALAKVIDSGRTLGQLTRDCTAKQRYDYRYCTPVLTLQTELAAAKRIAGDEVRLAEIRDGGAWVTRVGDAHSGASMIARTFKRFTGSAVEAMFVLDMLMLLGLAVVQLFSTILPYAVFPYKPRPAPHVLTLGATAAAHAADGPSSMDWGAADAKLEGKVSGPAGGKMNGVAVPAISAPGANAGAPNEKPVGMPAGEGTVASVDDGAKPSRRIPSFFPAANAGVSSLALTVSNGVVGPNDIGAFIAQYIDFGKGSTELAADVYRVYTGVVGPGLAHNAQAFLKRFRKSLPEGVKSRKANGVIRFNGLQLNAAGRQLSLS